MAETPLPWFRFYHEAATDPKFDVISMTTGIEWCAVFGAWSKILCVAASSPVRGSLYVTFQKRFSNANVTALLRFTNEQTDAIMQSLQDCDMLDLDEQGAYRVKNWGKRQYDSDNSTKRVKKFREKQNETLQKRPRNVSVTAPESDTDSESDTETDSGINENKSSSKESSDPCFSSNPLSVAFEQESHIRAPGTDPRKWIESCNKMAELGIVESDVKQATYQLIQKGYTVIGPSSVVNAAINVMARRKQGANGFDKKTKYTDVNGEVIEL
jgi:hypothetical protein